jgi:hypothetical protein
VLSVAATASFFSTSTTPLGAEQAQKNKINTINPLINRILSLLYSIQNKSKLVMILKMLKFDC